MLIVLAAAWSLAVLAVAGISLSTIFSHAAMARFDDELSNTVDGLLAGTSVGGGRVTPPVSDDPRTLRAYSGDYWQIATPSGGDLRAVARSRSLWDRALAAPPGGAAALAKEAEAENMEDLGRQCDSLKQQVQSALNKVSLLREKLSSTMS